MNRRDFFRGVLATAAVAAVPWPAPVGNGYATGGIMTASEILAREKTFEILLNGKIETWMYFKWVTPQEALERWPAP